MVLKKSSGREWKNMPLIACDTQVKLKIFITIFNCANKKSQCRKSFTKCWNLLGRKGCLRTLSSPISCTLIIMHVWKICGRRLFKNPVISWILCTDIDYYVWKICYSNQISTPFPHHTCEFVTSRLTLLSKKSVSKVWDDFSLAFWSLDIPY